MFNTQNTEFSFLHRQKCLPHSQVFSQMFVHTFYVEKFIFHHPTKYFFLCNLIIIAPPTQQFIHNPCLAEEPIKCAASFCSRHAHQKETA